MIITDITGGHLEDDNIIYSEEKQASCHLQHPSFCKNKIESPLSHQRYICYFSMHYTALIYSIYIYIAFKFSKVGLRLKCRWLQVTDH
jgi:hypothetical protein